MTINELWACANAKWKKPGGKESRAGKGTNLDSEMLRFQSLAEAFDLSVAYSGRRRSKDLILSDVGCKIS